MVAMLSTPRTCPSCGGPKQSRSAQCRACCYNPLPDPADLSTHRFWSRVDATGDCWEYVGGHSSDGYGSYGSNGAHRFAWTLLVGPIPNRMELDHLCRNVRCVNPDHLELVSHRTNVLRGRGMGARNARKTHCPKGHPYDESNTYLYPRGGRGCLTCARTGERATSRPKSTVCKYGHQYDLLYRGQQMCSICMKAANRRHYLKMLAGHNSSTPSGFAPR